MSSFPLLVDPMEQTDRLSLCPIQCVLSPANRDKQNIEFTATTGRHLHRNFSEEWR